ncbi:type II toxin-antitoxin system HicA family toxin [Phyllobacterium sp. UNC302MFCol5.2]|uniref:type II toxin-antitoxin system HicA family toxin n=1 Tax=Phyllobacterium sp. UNC302MFCol5.2 TaxID=1449065 RepID=UPI000ACEC520|nr:type II toxin-antitoxin system HicA family toxin [Phyllobacterium sp. UNC302MFCol5.2]
MVGYRKLAGQRRGRAIEGRGSRVKFEKDGELESFHRPHPTKEAKRYQVRAARAFLKRIGIEP